MHGNQTLSAEPDLSRIIIIGTSCSGKTTFARRLSAQLGAPHIELDQFYWLPDWQARQKQDFRRLVADAVERDRWIVDGNYRSSSDLFWSRATTVVWLNYPLRVVLFRGLIRTLRRSMTREELFGGNQETFAKSFFSRDSIILWLLQTHGKNRSHYRKLRESNTFPDLYWIEYRNPREAECAKFGQMN